MQCSDSQLTNKTGITISSYEPFTFSASKTFANLLDGLDTTNNVARYTVNTPLNNKTYLQFDLTTPTGLSFIEIGNLLNEPVLTAGGTYKIQGWNGTVWTDIVSSQTVAFTTQVYATNQSVKFSMPHNVMSYSKYRIVGISLTTTTGWLNEVYFQKRTCTSLDTDNDGIVNTLDLDSDGDGCSDAFEGGATTSITSNFAFTGQFGTNGLINSLETVADNGIINYGLTYNNAINAAAKTCIDTDEDGVRDVVDIDDDNDGVLDAVESPSCFFTATEATTIATVTSSLTAANDDQTDGDIQALHDNNVAVEAYKFNSGQQLSGATLFLVSYVTPIKLSKMSVFTNVSFGTGSTAKLQGSNNLLDWIDISGAPQIMTSTTTKEFTVTNSSEFRFYRVLDMLT